MTYNQHAPKTPSRFRHALATLAVTTFALTGCAVPSLAERPTDPAWQPRAVESISGLAVAGDDITFASIDGKDLPGIKQNRVTNANVGVDLRWPMVAGATDFNSELEQQQWSFIDAQEAQTGGNYSPQTGAVEDRGCAPGLTTASADSLREASPEATLISTCEFVAATGNTLGVRSRVIDGEADATVTTYFDVTTGDASDISEFVALDDAALESLWHEAVVAIRTNAGQITLWPSDDRTPLTDDSRAQLEAAISAGVLAEDGALVIDVPGGFTSPELDSLPGRDDPELHDRIRFTAEAIAPLMTEAGADLVSDLGTTAWQPQGDTAGTHASCALVPCVALTYDDGPNPEMSTLLDTFAEHDAVATFFFLGSLVAGNADVVQRTYDEGHELANHSWDHPDLTTLKPKELNEQVSKTQNAIAAVTGETPTLMRPPYGAYDDKVLAQIGMPVIMWDLDTLDWQQPPLDSLVADVLDNSQPGSIVLMHSIHDNTVAAAPQIIAGLQDRGYELVTVTELFDGEVPGGVVFSGR